MKIKLCLGFIALTAICFAQSPQERIGSSYRLRAKPGNNEALKAALITHAEKFHGGANSWRISQVISGTHEEMFQINEGPNTYAGLEERGDLGAEHTAQYNQTITPLVESRIGNIYTRYLADYSTAAVISPTPVKKFTLRHLYLKPGRMSHFMDGMKLIKNTWDTLGWNVAVYSTMYSGEPKVIIARRFTNGFKDFSATDGTKFTAAYDKVNGSGAYNKYLETLSLDVDKMDEEILEFLAAPIKK
jgi:hypothetical protein